MQRRFPLSGSDQRSGLDSLSSRRPKGASRISGMREKETDSRKRRRLRRARSSSLRRAAVVAVPRPTGCLARTARPRPAAAGKRHRRRPAKGHARNSRPDAVAALPRGRGVRAHAAKTARARITAVPPGLQAHNSSPLFAFSDRRRIRGPAAGDAGPPSRTMNRSEGEAGRRGAHFCQAAARAPCGTRRTAPDAPLARSAPAFPVGDSGSQRGNRGDASRPRIAVAESAHQTPDQIGSEATRPRGRCGSAAASATSAPYYGPRD